MILRLDGFGGTGGRLVVDLQEEEMVLACRKHVWAKANTEARLSFSTTTR